MKPLSYIDWDNLLAEYIFLKVVINYIEAYLNISIILTVSPLVLLHTLTLRNLRFKMWA